MYYVIVQHQVADYDRWRPIFDEHEPTRQSHGLTDARVFRGADDPNGIVIRMRVEAPEKAREFFASDNLKEVMKQAGVTSPPEIYFVETVS